MEPFGKIDQRLSASHILSLCSCVYFFFSFSCCFIFELQHMFSLVAKMWKQIRNRQDLHINVENNQNVLSQSVILN